MVEDFEQYNDINKATVNYFIFLQKFDAFWLKKPPIINSIEKSVILEKLDEVKNERLLNQNKTIFSMLDMNSNK